MLSDIKLIALDIYGTVLCSNDPENALPPRKGFFEFLLLANSRGLKVVSTSDAAIINLKIDLLESCRRIKSFKLQYFAAFYRLAMRPKRYEELLSDFGVRADELLVIGDNFFNDLSGAPLQAKKILVPVYQDGRDNFDFATLGM